MVSEKGRSCSCAQCEFCNIMISCFDEKIMGELYGYKEEQSFKKGEIINLEKNRIGHFKYLKKGIVKLYRSPSDADEQIITITRPYDFISNMSVFSEDKYQYSVSALEDSVVCAIELDFIKRLCLKQGKFAMELLSRISMISNKIITQTLDLRQKNLSGRVAYVLLLFLHEIFKSKVFEVPVSRKEIAGFIGMSSANVIRTLSDFKRAGIIKIFGKRIEIVDLERLEVIEKRG